MSSHQNIYEFVRINGTYQPTNNKISTPSNIQRMGLSYGLIVTAHGDKYLRLYRPSDFGFERALLAGSLGVKGFSQTNNGSLLVVGGYDKWMRIFAFDGVDYTELQAIYAGFSVIFAKITEEKLIVLGGNQIEIYESNGTHYLRRQAITANGTSVFQMLIPEDMSEFIFGGNSKAFAIYELTNGTYELIYREEVGK